MKWLLLLIAASHSILMLGPCAGFARGQEIRPFRSVPISDPPTMYLNVRNYGAVGDGVHDDGPAILAAVTAAANGNIKIVEFPATTASYLIAAPLQLPNHPNGWIRLNLDGPLRLGATLSIADAYVIYGNNPNSGVQFSENSQVLIDVNPPVNPAIHVIGSDVRLENLEIWFGGGGTGEGIQVDNVCCFTAENVGVAGQSGRDGVSVHIIGDGFSYLFEKGIYINEATAPNFVIDGTSECNTIGFLTMRDVSLAGHGIQLNLPCGQAANYHFENILFESFQDPFLTINGTTMYTAVFGLHFDNILLADPVGPIAPFITNNNAFTQDVQIINCWGNSVEMTGTPILDLEIWTGVDVSVGQPSNYVYHGPSGVVSTMPTGADISRRAITAPIRPPSVKGFLPGAPQ